MAEKKKRVYPPRESVPRLSVTLPPEVRKKIRLAAALADMEPSEWCRVVLVQMARRTVEKHFPEKV